MSRTAPLEGLGEDYVRRPGPGRLLVDATLSRKHPLSTAIFPVFSISVTPANRLSDLIYHGIDPRLHYA